MAELYQVELKGSRREYFYNTYYHTLTLNDYVIIQLEQGEDMGLLTKKINSEIDFPANVCFGLKGDIEIMYRKEPLAIPWRFQAKSEQI